MFDDQLFREAMELSDVPKGLPLVAGLTGFADAGGVVTQVNRYLLDALESERVGRSLNPSSRTPLSSKIGLVPALPQHSFQAT